MTKEKKENPPHIVCNPHNFIVVSWSKKGMLENATGLRCSHCLMHVNLEQLDSKEWKESQGF